LDNLICGAARGINQWRARTMKRKFLSGIHWDFLDLYSSKHTHIDDIFSGYISLIKINRIKRKIFIDYEQSETILLDDGYKCIMFLPDNEKWCVSAVYNPSNEIVEWYFDMIKESAVDEHGGPYYDDLYLDIAVSPDFRIEILDEDELREALELKEITKSDYDMAHDTCNKIIKEIITNRDFLISFFDKYLVQLGN
jgi:predicted RNA-binding protein associated with RNAse of E/G family